MSGPGDPKDKKISVPVLHRAEGLRKEGAADVSGARGGRALGWLGGLDTVVT